MKVGIITKSNKKGQIVIPKKFRETLGIDENDLLNLVIRDNGIYISPVFDVVTKIEVETSYPKMLERTKGKWSEDWERLNKKRRKIELGASKKRKQQSW